MQTAIVFFAVFLIITVVVIVKSIKSTSAILKKMFNDNDENDEFGYLANYKENDNADYTDDIKKGDHDN